jgi:hypothetical protein
VKVHNSTPYDIEIDYGAKLLKMVPSNGYSDISCVGDSGCSEWSIRDSSGLRWKGSVPCKSNHVIEINGGGVLSLGGLLRVSFGETTLPSVASTPRSIPWLWILLVILLLIGLVVYFVSSPIKLTKK